uniref:FH2 domain-containing protein n=1 Tax=Clastoptera arizonana TaxID=38151 RepID=A0A1B6D1V3_9HEMI
MESRIGLDYIVDNPEYTAKLAAALDTNNVTVKKQVFELLSALCVYNSEGYARALDALEDFKNLKCERYRLKIVVSELQEAAAVDYQTALVAFINCLIISTPQLHDRIRIRNEFIGLKLLPVLNNLRQSARGVPDLGVQLDVFDEQRESDDTQVLHSPHSVDLSSHLDVFYAILRQVADTPQEIPFLSILQHLLRIDPKEAVSDIVWDTAERLVHRATLLEGREDATRLLRSPSLTAKHPLCGSRKQSLNTSTPGPPPPPPPPPVPGPPPPPPPPPLAPPQLPSTLPKSTMGGGPPPPPLLNPPITTTTAPDLPDIAADKLPQQETPTPRTKMKTINWNKIPNNKVVGKHNIWSLVARSHQHSPMADLDWDEMEDLFCQQAPPAPTPSSSTTASPRLGSRDSADSVNKRKEPTEIVLLDGKRSLNINIFLKQFRSSNENIIQVIRDGEHDEIGAEKLRGLLKILPELDELEMLRSFDGDKNKLGNAEKFLLQLIEVPNYKLRIESMLLKEEFAANMSYLEPSINAMIVAGEDLMTNKPLQEVLYMVLVAGNFLNSGGYAGNAAGVKLSSLQKLTDIRANKPGMNLIHYVALQAEKKRKDLLKFHEDLTALEDATKTTVEQLQNEINTLDTRIKKIRKQIDLPTTEKEIKAQMIEFLQIAQQEVGALQKDMNELESVRKSLSDFFCEDPGTFKLEECFRVFQGFCIKFKQAVAENERRRLQEEQAIARRRQREEQLAFKKRQFGGHSNGSESDCNIVDSLLHDIRSGFPHKKDSDKEIKLRRLGNGIMTSEEDVSVPGSPCLSRRRLGSFSGDQLIREDTCSPDVTPTGSLRRRRSRVPSEEDESTLMDFLRSTGQQDGSRERKSWGSLDRSWARRARGGGRKRPELLSADFSGERERPNSPSPLAENKPLLPAAPEEETKPRAWRQKIEAWLQENEKEEKQSEELRRRTRRIQSNRRSFENDSESERSTTLDTLPEGKLAEASQYKRVYSDWKPTIDKTDVVGTMEAIAEAQPQLKDKSAWRKSTLNIQNSSEETESDFRRLRRMRSRGSMDSMPSSTLQVNYLES